MSIKLNMYGDLLRNFILPTSLRRRISKAVAGKLPPPPTAGGLAAFRLNQPNPPPSHWQYQAPAHQPEKVREVHHVYILSVRIQYAEAQALQMN